MAVDPVALMCESSASDALKEYCFVLFTYTAVPENDLVENIFLPAGKIINCNGVVFRVGLIEVCPRKIPYTVDEHLRDISAVSPAVDKYLLIIQ